MPSFFDMHRHKLRAIAQRARGSSLSKNTTSSTKQVNSFQWNALPTEIRILIFSQCSLSDIFNFRLVSQAFRDVIDSNEADVARSYLRIRRHGSLPKSIEDIDRENIHEAADDIRLLSDLFLPPKASNGISMYSLGYLRALNVRQDVCTRLSYHLAEAVMNLYESSPSYPLAKVKFSKEQWKYGKTRLSERLRPSLFYILFFCEAYSRSRLDHQNALHIDYDSGRLPAPMTAHDRANIYRTLQMVILDSPPFTHTPTLHAANHTMQILYGCLRTTIAGNPRPWISTLLNYSGLARIAEFFAAEEDHHDLTLKSGNKRKEFMKNMEKDNRAFRRDSLRAVVFAEDGTEAWDLARFWFEAYQDVIRRRASVPHAPEQPVEIAPGRLVALSCGMCEDVSGWAIWRDV